MVRISIPSAILDLGLMPAVRRGGYDPLLGFGLVLDPSPDPWLRPFSRVGPDPWPTGCGLCG
jgi:hypothetical protein